MNSASELAAALGAKRSGRQWRCRCVAHEDAEPSMIIFDGHTGVQVRCLANVCTPADIIAVLKERGLWGAVTPFGGRPQNGRPVTSSGDRSQDDPRRPTHNSHPPSTHNSHIALAQAIFARGARLPLSMMVVDYYQGRSLRPVLDLSCARFVERCPRGDQVAPAIVVAMHEIGRGQGPIRAVQRIYLKRDSDAVVKDGTPMMLGDAGGSAMKLTPHGEAFWDELSYCPTLNICEGFETGIALLRDGVKPVWALGSAGAIARMPILFGVGAITVWADNDRSRFNRAGETVNPGMDAALACCERWTEAGRPTRLMWREDEGKDFADA
jgi:putative DNA primase/helicase